MLEARKTFSDSKVMFGGQSENDEIVVHAEIVEKPAKLLVRLAARSQHNVQIPIGEIGWQNIWSWMVGFADIALEAGIRRASSNSNQIQLRG